MHDGIVQQVGTPDTLYERPANLFVADFLGKMNVFKGRGADKVFLTEAGQRIAAPGGPGATHLGVRPERVSLRDQPAGGTALAGVVESSLYLGSVLEVRVQLEGGNRMISQVVNGGARQPQPAPGARVYACFEPDDCVAFTQ
jgi:putative spermidine/putrescine transport system ATP-binding protein